MSDQANFNEYVTTVHRVGVVYGPPRTQVQPHISWTRLSSSVVPFVEDGKPGFAVAVDWGRHVPEVRQKRPSFETHAHRPLPNGPSTTSPVSMFEFPGTPPLPRATNPTTIPTPPSMPALPSSAVLRRRPKREE